MKMDTQKQINKQKTNTQKSKKRMKKKISMESNKVVKNSNFKIQI